MGIKPIVKRVALIWDKEWSLVNKNYARLLELLLNNVTLLMRSSIKSMIIDHSESVGMTSTSKREQEVTLMVCCVSGMR